MKVKVFKPSSVLADIGLGEIFLLDDRRYMLIARNPWTAKIARYTKFDEFLVKLIDRFRNKR